MEFSKVDKGHNLKNIEKKYIASKANMLIIRFVSQIMLFFTIVIFLIASLQEKTFNFMIWNDTIFYIIIWLISFLITIIVTVSKVTNIKKETIEDLKKL